MTGTDDTLRRWAAPRPVWGATLLVLGHLVLLCRAVWAPGPLTAALTLETAVVAVSLLGVVAGLVALVRVGVAPGAGTVGATLAVGSFALVVLAPLELYYPELTVVGLVTATAGGLACTGERSVGLRTGPALRAGQVFLVVAIVAVLAASAPAVGSSGAATYPNQTDDLGGFVVYQDIIYADAYDYTPSCSADQEEGNGCISSEEHNLDSTTFESNGITDVEGYESTCEDTLFGVCTGQNPYGLYVARQELNTNDLDDYGDRPVELGTENGQTSFYLYKDYYNPDTEQMENFEISGDVATADGAATGDDDDGTNGTHENAVDLHAHEFRAPCLQFTPGILGSNISAEGLTTWTEEVGAEPDEAGSINDVRSSLITLGLPIDASVTLLDGETRTISISALQLGSTRTTIQDFELRVESGEHEALVPQEPPYEPVESGNTTGDNCPDP